MWSPQCGRTHQRCLDDVGHSLCRNDVWFDRLITVLSLLLSLAIYPSTLGPGCLIIRLSGETYSRTTIKGRPCSSLMTEAIVKVSWNSNQVYFFVTSGRCIPCDKSSSEKSQSTIFHNEGYCGHTHSHVDSGLRGQSPVGSESERKEGLRKMQMSKEQIQGWRSKNSWCDCSSTIKPSAGSFFAAEQLVESCLPEKAWRRQALPQSELLSPRDSARRV